MAVLAPRSSLNRTLALPASITRSLASVAKLSIEASLVNRTLPPATLLSPVSVSIRTSVLRVTMPLNRTASFVVVRTSLSLVVTAVPPLRVMPVPVMTSSEPRSRAFPDVPSPTRLIWLTGPVSPVSVSA